MVGHHAPCTKHQQSGLSLIEALVSTLLLLITFVGMNQLLTRSLTLQGHDFALSLALYDVREQLQQTDKGVIALCDGSGQLSGLPISQGVTPTANCSSTSNLNVTLPGISGSIAVPVQDIEITTPDSEQSDNLTGQLFGGDGVISLSTTLNTP